MRLSVGGALQGALPPRLARVRVNVAKETNQNTSMSTASMRELGITITNLERELTEALRSLETTLDILTDPAKSEYSIGDYTVRLCEEDMQKIAVAVGIPEGFKAGSDSGAAHRSLLSFSKEFLNYELSLQLAKE